MEKPSDWNPTAVRATFDLEGRIRPQTFVWGGQQWPVTDVGRQWTDDEGLHHVLVMISGPRTFELRFDPAQLRWEAKRVSGPETV
ncbi:MAG: hypothetical protein MAG451_01371 [Anaerolineales bacterium]|nr:hypothetical protein [Anaerolineales bacterium]